MKNYYDEIMEKITEAVNNNNFDEAFRIVSEELNAPYVPNEFEEQLEEIHSQIMENLNLKDNDFSNWNTDKVLEIMSKKINQDAHLLAFDALRGLNARLIIEDIKEYLVDEEIKAEYKTFLLMVLIEQAIDQDVVIQKNNQTMTINPSKFKLNDAQDILRDIELKIEQVVYDKNPSLFSFCQHIAKTFFYNKFPMMAFDTYSLNDLAMAIILKAENSLGLEEEKQFELELEFNKDNTMLLLNELNDII